MATQKCIEIARAVHECNYVHFVISNDSINEPVRSPDDPLSETNIGALRNDTTTHGELPQLFRGSLSFAL